MPGPWFEFACGFSLGCIVSFCAGVALWLYHTRPIVDPEEGG
jgi:hypothetical protein